MVICPRIFFGPSAMKSSGIHPFTWQGSLCEAFSWCRSLINSVPFEMHNSYCPSLLGYEIILRNLQGCSSFQCRHCIACLLMRKPHLCFSTSSSTFSLVTLKFHCLGTLFFQLEFFLFDNCFNSSMSYILHCNIRFLCMFFYLVKSASYL